MWLLDGTTVVNAQPSVWVDLWHTILVAVAVWLGNKMHVATGGNGNGN